MSCFNDKKIVIAVDGFSSCGKSTFAKMVAARVGYVFIDTGAMYRAVTLYALENGAIDNGEVNAERLISMLDRILINFKFNPERGASDIYIGDRCVEDQIRGIEVSNQVSKVSSIPAVRSKLVVMQKNMGLGKGVVMDGRDIGTVVFPDAELKIFMTANLEVRAERRFKELQAKGEKVSMEQVMNNIVARDEDDINREISPLKQAEDAIVLDNSCMTVDEELKWFDEQFDKVINR